MSMQHQTNSAPEFVDDSNDISATTSNNNENDISPEMNDIPSIECFTSVATNTTANIASPDYEPISPIVKNIKKRARGLYPCLFGECIFLGRDRSDLRRHENRKHSGKPKRCPACNKNFKCEFNMNRHYNSMHKK